MPVLSATHPDVVDGVYYPSSDAKPMAETGIHVLTKMHLFQFLRFWYRDRKDVYIAADMFWYWERGIPSACVSPEIMVNFGVPEDAVERRSFKTWVENDVVPSVTFEMASQKTWRKNLGATKDNYERLGVKEYFIFDPEDLYLESQLMGFRLRSKHYVRIASNPDGSMVSQILGMKFVPDGMYLRPADATTGALLKNELEEQIDLTSKERRRAEQARRRAEDASRRAEEESRRAQEEQERAAALAEEVARLRAQLKQRKNGKNGSHS
jgi:hypothetical protein